MREKAKEFFQDRNGKVIVFQWPNLPLSIWMAAVGLQFLASGRMHAVASMIGTAALLIWAFMEAGWGLSWFRRSLGIVVFLASFANVLSKIYSIIGHK